MKTTKKTTAESKAKYATLTALADSNGDYSSNSAATGSNTSAATSSSMSEYGSLTASQDANNDYFANTVSSPNQNSKANSQKQATLTSAYDANDKP